MNIPRSSAPRESAIPRVPGLEMEALFQPSGGVGGDVLEFVTLDPSRIMMFIANVSGKGVPASLVVAQTHDYLQSKPKHLSDPAQAMLGLNDLIQGHVPARMYMTGVYLIQDLEKQEIRILNCGHRKPLLFRSVGGVVEELDVPGTAIGSLPTPALAKALDPKTVKIFPHDRLMICTDGLSEARNPSNRRYGDERLGEAFAKFAGESSRRFLDRMTADLDEFLDGRPFRDDLTLLTYQYDPVYLPRANPNVGSAKVAPPKTLDPLTRLPNDPAFDSWPQGSPTSVLLLDVDGLAKVNEEHGRTGGDALLRTVAKGLKQTLPGNSLPGRLRGDSFFIILGGWHQDTALEQAEKVRAWFHKLRSEPALDRPTLSIGLATYPDDATSPEGTLRRAQLALELSKRRGGDCITIPGTTCRPAAIEVSAEQELAAPNLAGRPDEVTLIETAAHDASQGRPRVILVRGKAGTGRTRIWEETTAAAAQNNIPSTRIVCADAEKNDPYRSIARALLNLARRYPRTHRQALHLLPLENFVAMGREFPELTEGVKREGQVEFESEEMRRQLLFLALALMLVRWSRWRGICLGIENGRACDRASVELLRWMLTSRAFRCLILLDMSEEALRADDPRNSTTLDFLKDYRFGPHLWEFRADPFTADEVDEFIEKNLLQVNPDVVFRDAALGQTDGHPLRLTSWIRSLMREGKLRASPLHWQAELNGLPSEPLTAPALIDTCLGAADRDAYEVMDIACVAGLSCTFDLLAQVADWNIGHVYDVVRRLQEAGVLRDSESPGWIEFASESFRDARYDGLAEDRRRALHLKIAGLLEAESRRPGGIQAGASAYSIAFHLERAGALEKARSFSNESEKLALKRYPFEEIKKLRNLDPAYELMTVRPCEKVFEGESIKLADATLRAFSNAVKSSIQYPKNSPALEPSFRLFHDAITALFKREEGITVTLHPNQVAINEMPPKELGEDEELPEFNVYLHTVLKKKHMYKVTILRDAPDPDLNGMLKLLAEKTSAYEIAAREDYWQIRADQAGLMHAAIIPIVYTDESAGDAADVAGAAEALRDREEEIKGFFKSLTGGTQAKLTYPDGSQVIIDTVLELHRMLKGLLKVIPGITLGNVGLGVVLNGVHADERRYGALVSEVAALLRERNLKSISFTGDVLPVELDTMVGLLGREDISGEEQFQDGLDDENVTSIAVGTRAFQYRDSDVGTGKAKVRGPLEEAAVLIDAEETELVDKATVKQLVPILESTAAAKRQDLTCRLIKRYVILMRAAGSKPETRELAAQAVSEGILGTSPRTRKFVLKTAQAALIDLLSNEPPGPVFDKLSPLVLDMVKAALEARDWEMFVAQGQGLRDRKGTDASSLLEKAYDKIAGDKKFRRFFDAFKSDYDRVSVEPAVRLLGERAIPNLVKIIHEVRSLATRSSAAHLLKEQGPNGWVKLLASVGLESPRQVCVNVLEILPIALENPEDASGMVIRLARHPDEAVFRRLLSWADYFGRKAAAEIVRRSLWREEEKVQLKGLRIGTTLRLQDAAPAVIDLLRRTQSEEALIACCRFFEKVPSPLAVEGLARLAVTRTGTVFVKYNFAPAIRIAAIKALAANGGDVAEVALGVAAKDRDKEVRKIAREILEPDG